MADLSDSLRVEMMIRHGRCSRLELRESGRVDGEEVRAARLERGARRVRAPEEPGEVAPPCFDKKIRVI